MIDSTPSKPPQTPRSAARTQGLGGGRTLLLSVVAAATVASLYYCQPVLGSMGKSLSVGTDEAGWTVVAALLGNALAQMLVVPLVDQLERRRLTQLVLSAQLLGMIGMATAPNLTVALISSAVIGAGASGAMTLLPYAVGLSGEDQRGRVTGAVMSGVLFGILLSRSASGFVSSWIGWRMTYVIAAVMCVAAMVALQSIPQSRVNADRMRYRQLLRSLGGIIRGDRLVQRHMALGALGFISFNLLWTGLTLLLSGTSYHFSDAVIGLFGLLGAVGALVARNTGRWHDNGHARRSLWWGWTVMTAAWLITASGNGGGMSGLGALILGVLLLDVGMQAQHITNQSILLSARTAKAGRVTTVYMGSNVIAGAVGSSLATQLFPLGGWISLSTVGLGCGLLSLIILGVMQRSQTEGAQRVGGGQNDVATTPDGGSR